MAERLKAGSPAAAAVLPNLPEELQVEVTGACNLRCRMCLVRYAPAVGRKEGALDFEQFLGLVDSLPRIKKITLQGLGEPLLSPHLLEMVRHAVRRGAAVGFNTNGVLLDAAIAKQLIAAGLSWLHVSLDGATEATYQDVRHGPGLQPRPGQFDSVVANLRRLVAIRRELGTKTPQIQVVFVAMRRNVAELKRLTELAADIGVDELFVQNLSHDFGDAGTESRYEALQRYVAQEALFGPELDYGRTAFERARRRADELGFRLRLPQLEERPAGRRAGEPGCFWPWRSAYVTHRGEVQPCCMVMGSDRATLGDLNTAGFEEIWGGQSYARFRERLLTDDPPAVCRGCSLYRGLF
jgi:radical SAM protein with 4Fe4S-binding SPASM domain